MGVDGERPGASRVSSVADALQTDDGPVGVCAGVEPSRSCQRGGSSEGNENGGGELHYDMCVFWGVWKKSW